MSRSVTIIYQIEGKNELRLKASSLGGLTSASPAFEELLVNMWVSIRRTLLHPERLFTIIRLSTETQKVEPIGSIPAPEKVYGRNQMVRMVAHCMHRFSYNLSTDLKSPFEVRMKTILHSLRHT